MQGVKKRDIDWIRPFNVVISSDINIRILSTINKLGKIPKEELFELCRARNEGIFAEPASSAPVASLQKEIVYDNVDHDTKIVCLVTSSGLKTDDILRNVTKRKKSPRLGSRLATKERILRIINQGPSYGYAIWKNLGLDMTIGAVYQHLTYLEKKGLIKSTQKGKRKELDITERGKRALDALDDLQVLL